MDLWTVTGTIASVAGLGVSIWVLRVAKDAREAAQGARSHARKRNLIEELDSAYQKIQQVGNFIQQEQWAAVRIRTEEIQASCKLTLTRWPDHLSEERRNEVLSASSQMMSIAKLASGATGPLTQQQKRWLSDAHMRASGHISSALGEARKEEERDADNGN